MSYQSRNTQAIINLAALSHNYQQVAELAPNSDTIAVIKANAYGHGATAVAKCLDSFVPAFAVAFIDEALVLRAAGIRSPILILEGPFSPQDFAVALKEQFWLMLHNPMQLEWLTALPNYAEKLWLKVDTGMNRLGFASEELSSIIKYLPINVSKQLVLCTHFASAEQTENPKTLQQIACLQQLAQVFSGATSLANSAGIINWQQSHSDYNRLGIALYGVSPNKNQNLPALRSVMTLQSTIIALRKINTGDSVGYGELWQAKQPSQIATVAIGYADGYPRNVKAGTPVWVNGHLAPIVGRVSMDMITINVTELVKNVEIKLGDSVELWGNNLAVEQIAQCSDTITYELLTRVSERVPRVYQPAE